jgi:hypothetical protein
MATAFRAIGRATAGLLAATLTARLAGLATFLTLRAAFADRAATFRGRFALARVDAEEPAPRRRDAAFGAGLRLAFRAVFARVLADFFDFLDFAGLAARLGPAARRPLARFAFALAMTLLVCPPPMDEAVGCRAAV